MRVAVEHELCEGHGQCVAIAPQLFRLNERGLAEVLAISPDETLWVQARAAAASCPAAAIMLEESAS